MADLADVERRANDALAGAWPGSSLSALAQLTGGTSSLTYEAQVADGRADRVVVKMAPPGLDPVRNRDVLRQARVLQALAVVSAVRVPEVYATDSGTPPEVPPLFVMQYVDGESYEPRHAAADEGRHATDAQVRARVRAAVEMLAALQAQDPAALGLGDEPPTSLDDEVARWRRAFDSCELPPATVELQDACHQRLHAKMPAPLPPVILHGDWRLGNMQCAGDDVRGVIDWEIWSVGDPRIDLAWMMLMADAGHPSARSRSTYMPSPQEHRTWYDEARGTAVPDLDWAQALVRYKQSAASALLVKNAMRRGESGELVNRMRDGIAALLEWGLGFLP